MVAVGLADGVVVPDANSFKARTAFHISSSTAEFTLLTMKGAFAIFRLPFFAAAAANNKQYGRTASNSRGALAAPANVACRIRDPAGQTGGVTDKRTGPRGGVADS
ncbi:hypothetical protein ACCO45_004696 [Purpureocillium lilacinum]|uniref:Uncharacterized protein n=1 Tax=Purpureocillium lilacinum TaxID=33203 RepID=A0ACC4DVJ5_PURLI